MLLAIKASAPSASSVVSNHRLASSSSFGWKSFNRTNSPVRSSFVVVFSFSLPGILCSDFAVVLFDSFLVFDAAAGDEVGLFFFFGATLLVC